jgi:hypothetical protein
MARCAASADEPGEGSLGIGDGSLRSPIHHELPMKEVMMIPNYLGVPVEEMIWLKREDLMRDFEQMRLVRAARISNPGLLERAWLLLAQAMLKFGQRLQEQYTMPRQTYVDCSARLAA